MLNGDKQEQCAEHGSIQIHSATQRLYITGSMLDNRRKYRISALIIPPSFDPNAAALAQDSCGRLVAVMKEGVAPAGVQNRSRRLVCADVFLSALPPRHLFTLSRLVSFLVCIPLLDLCCLQIPE